MKRKLTLIAATVALGALLVTGATLAWFTSTDTATNVVTVGNVSIEILETSEDKNAISTENGIEWTGAMTPGQVLSKVPTIDNIGKNDAWVRANVTMEYLKNGEPVELPEGVAVPVINYNTSEGSNWIAGEDGFYYYKEALTTDGAGKVTTPLFDTVTIPNTWTNQGEISMANVTVKVVVNAEAIQYDNNNAGGVLKAFEGFKAE